MKKNKIEDWNEDYDKAWNPDTEKFEKINSFWDKLKWNLFGEFRFTYWIIAILMFCFIFFRGIILSAAFHLTHKMY